MKYAWTALAASMLAFALLAAPANFARADPTTFAVTNRGATFYIINGTNNPSLTLVRGKTYTFNVIATNHPFWITTAPGAANAAADAFSTGVTNNGASVETVSFTVPDSAPDVLYYQCSFHDSMSGFLNIVNGPNGADGPVPSWALALLGMLLILTAGARMNRTREAF